MVSIVETNSITELQTLISGLSLSTETSSNLVLILKSASLAGVDSSSIKTELLSRITAATTSTTLDEIAILIAALPLITDNRSISVTNITDLSSLTVDPGTVCFVINENLPYVYRSDSTWVLLFPNLQGAKPLNNLWSWGYNSRGQLGDGTVVDKSSPVSVVGGFTDWAQVSAGGTHSLALRSNGTAWAWGDGVVGRLGDNTTVDKSSPVSVVGGFTDWIQVSASSDAHSLGLRANGTVWSWGYNGSGQLGDASVVDKSSPVSVVGGFSDWIQISAGKTHSLALRSNGTAWAWGRGSEGRLGDNTSINKSSPVSVIGGFTNWIQVSAGGSHSLGVRSNGTAWAWGLGLFGLLGDNTIANKSSPVSVVGGFTDWIQVSAARSNSFGLRGNGTVWAWGAGGYGRLGDNTNLAKSSPVSVVGGFTDWVQVSSDKSSVVVRANGTAWSWGIGDSGILGDGSATQRSSPVLVIGGYQDWVQVAGGYGHTLGVRGG